MELEKEIKKGEFDSADDLFNYLKTKAKKHNYHKYYAPKNYIDDILKNHCLYFSNGKNWNDKIDRDSFNTNDAEFVYFGLCLSYSRSENIAMWMLYSRNNGCMIDYERTLINDILSTGHIALGYFEDNQFKVDSFLSSDFEIIQTDVIYYDDNKDGENYYYVKRSDETNKKFNKELVHGLARCKKTVAWSYENECRIIISIPQKHISPSVTHVKIEFDEKYVEKMKPRIYDSPNATSLTYNESTLAGKINWDLCKDCKEKCMNSECHNRKIKE